jgi:hypothetical protein
MKLKIVASAPIKKSKLIVVDVQPAYRSSIHFDLAEFCKFLGSYSEILYLYNGPDLGYEDDAVVISGWLQELGDIKQSTLRKIRFEEKDYGGLRDAMDTLDEDQIVEIMQQMIQKGLRSSNELDPAPEGDLQFSAFDYEEVLPRWNGADIVGGGRNECLQEVLLWAEALGVTVHPVDRFIY